MAIFSGSVHRKLMDDIQNEFILDTYAQPGLQFIRRKKIFCLYIYLKSFQNYLYSTYYSRLCNSKACANINIM